MIRFFGMTKFEIALLIVLAFVVQFAHADCPEFSPLGKQIAVPHAVELCNDFYAVEFDTELNAAIVSVEKFIHGDHTAKRSNDFFSDSRIDKTARASNSDYVHARLPDNSDKYDKGHLTPAADAVCIGSDSTSDCALKMHWTFCLCNMTPQSGKLNEGAWRLLEINVRKLDPDYVATGAIYPPAPATIGAHHIPVPLEYYKLVYKEGKIQAWVAENKSTATITETTVEQVELASGLQFPRY